MSEPFRIVHVGSSRWVKCDDWLREKRDTDAARFFKRQGVKCDPSPKKDLEIPCPGERELTFGAATQLDNEGEREEGHWMRGRGPCTPSNYAAPIPKSRVLDQIWGDKDLFYRMNRWAGTPAEGVAAANYGTLHDLDPAQDRPAEEAYARDRGPGGDDKGVVKCAPPPDEGSICVLERLERDRTDERGDLTLADTSPHHKEEPTGSFHAFGWDIQYGFELESTGAASFWSGSNRLRLCIKATFRCWVKPKRGYMSWGGGDGDHPVIWSWGDPRGGAGAGAADRMFGNPKNQAHGRCGCSARGECSCGGGTLTEPHVRGASQLPLWRSQARSQKASADPDVWEIAALREQFQRGGSSRHAMVAHALFQAMQVDARQATQPD